MRGMLFLVWSVVSPTLVWYLTRRRYAAEAQRLRGRNAAAAAEQLELEAKYDETMRSLNTAIERVGRNRSSLIEEQRAHAETRKRVEVAEGIVRGQAKHIDALQGSNDTMLKAITDMRRVGFSLPSDVLHEPDPDTITSVHDDDLQAIKDQPHLAAADDL